MDKERWERIKGLGGRVSKHRNGGAGRGAVARSKRAAKRRQNVAAREAK